MVTGVGIAYIGIWGIQTAKNPEPLATKISSAVSTVSSWNLPHLFAQELAYEADGVREEVGEDILFTGENLTAQDPSGAAISALAYSVQSLDKNNVLISKDADRPLPIASITKLATAVVARKLFKEDDRVTITKDILSTEGIAGRFKLGDIYRVDDILYPLLMVSSNDAAEALSQTYDARHGKKGKFVAAMNDWAHSIGATKTFFKDASGLSPQNVSTAHDLSLIAKWINENDPEIFKITLTKSKNVGKYSWTNPTHFLSFSSYTGGKNGYTPEAKLTTLALFSLGDPKRLYSVVLLGSKSRDKDALTILNEAVK